MKKDSSDLIIRINSKKENYLEINKIFNIKESKLNSFWELSVPSLLIEDAYLILIDKFKFLKEIQIEKDDISLWLLYEYENQCNMEFTPIELNLLSKLDITFCISCWEK